MLAALKGEIAAKVYAATQAAMKRARAAAAKPARLPGDELWARPEAVKRAAAEALALSAARAGVRRRREAAVAAAAAPTGPPAILPVRAFTEFCVHCACRHDAGADSTLMLLPVEHGRESPSACDCDCHSTTCCGRCEDGDGCSDGCSYRCHF
jgi:hypothetical protein